MQVDRMQAVRMAVCLAVCCGLLAGCGAYDRGSDINLSTAAQELAAGIEAAPAPGTGILVYECEEREVPMRIQRVASVRHGAGTEAARGASGVSASSGTHSTKPFFLPQSRVQPDESGRAQPSVESPSGTVRHTTVLSVSTRQQPVPALWQKLALEAQEIFGLDAALVLAVIRAESSFNPVAVSSAGAEGAMQIMPGTQEELGLIDPFDPRANVYAGAQYLMEQLQRFGSVELALAAYNAGPASVERYGGIPPFAETQAYVQRVMAYWEASRRSD